MNLSLDPVITRVYRGIFIGNYIAASQKETFEKYLIRRVVSVVDGRTISREFYNSLGVLQIKFSVHDNAFTDEKRELLTKVMPWIHEGCQRGVLIHCHASISRSPGLAMAYLMWGAGKKFEEALALVSLHPAAATPPHVLASFLTAVGLEAPPPWYTNWARERYINIGRI